MLGKTGAEALRFEREGNCLSVRASGGTPSGIRHSVLPTFQPGKH